MIFDRPSGRVYIGTVAMTVVFFFGGVGFGPSARATDLTKSYDAASTTGGASMLPLAEDVNQALRLRFSEVVTLDLDDAAPGEVLTITLPIEGVWETLDLRPYSIRSPLYQLVAQVDDGSYVELPPGVVRTLRGEIVDQPGSIVAGSLLEDGLHALIVFADGTRFWIEPLAPKLTGASSQHYALYRDSDVIPSDGTCGFDPDKQARIETKTIDVQPHADGGVAGSVLYTAQLACDADFEYFQAYGSTAAVEARINSVTNTMNVQYERDVNITHVITTIIVRTTSSDPYTSTNAGTRLDQFAAEWQANQTGIVRDVAELFTGVNIDGGTIGIAWLSGICSTSTGYGLVQSDCCGSDACATDLSAHELGHLWSAFHCSCTGPDYTMNPFITCVNRFHSTFTIPDILSFRNSRGCLTTGAGGVCGNGILEPGEQCDDGNLIPGDGCDANCQNEIGGNDLCANAIDICPGTVNGTTSGMNNDGSASCGSSTTSPDVWYTYTPGSSGTMTVDTCGSSYDTVLSVHSVCTGTSGNELVCNDDTCGLQSTVSTAVVGGSTYIIRVSGFSGSTGSFVLNLAGPACGSGDTTPPSPDPMAFSTAPAATSTSSITMTATTATDSQTSPVTYQFDFVSGGIAGTDSGWQSSRTYADGGLSPNASYIYRVRARDAAGTPNVTTYSSNASVYTLAIVPAAPSLSGATASSVSMNVLPNGNPSSTAFAVQCASSNPFDGVWNGKYVNAAGNPSGAAVWQTDAAWGTTVVSGLNAVTQYTFRVMARNGDMIETALGATASITTLGCGSSPDCDDGQFCNGPETCVGGTCQTGTNPCTNPSFPFCDEANDACDACTNNAHCDDGQFCNGTETCVGGACQAGTNPCTDPSFPFCDEANDGCDACTTNAHCDDGLFCNGAETCDATGACVAGSDPCTGLGCDDVNDVCTALAGACCLPDGTCDDTMTQTDCDDVLGVFDGVGSACPTSFACDPVPTLLSCQLESNTAAPGSSLLLDVLLQDTANLRGYEVWFEIVRTSGTGTVSVPCPGGARIDESRPDYVFSGEQSFSAANCALNRAISAIFSGGVVVGSAPRYLADFTLDVSADATVGSTFEVRLLPYPTSLLADSNDVYFPYRISPACVLTIADTGACCTSEGVCVDNMSLSACDAVLGRFDGVGSTCATAPPCDPVASMITCQLVSSFVAPGGTVSLETFVENVADLRGYETLFQITRTSGTGTVTVPCPGGATIDESRPDFVFFGEQSFSAANCALNRAISAIFSGGVVVGSNPLYLADFALEASADATIGSTFDIQMLAYPTSLLADSNDVYFPFRVGPPCTLTIGDGGACCMPDATCVDGLTQDACELAVGVFSGIGTTCATIAPCPSVQTLFTCQLANTTATAGSAVALDVFLENVDDLRGYEAKVEIVRTSGTGTVDVPCPGGVQIDEARPDHIFFGLDPFSAADCLGMRGISALASGGVNVGATPLYLVDYVLQVSADAAVGSTFEISFVTKPGTLIRDSNSDPLPYLLGPPCTLTVVSCTPPTVQAEGSRHLDVTPGPGTANVAYLVTGDASDPDVSCVSLYVQADGTLGTTPVFQPPSVWVGGDGLIHVSDIEVIPSSLYHVQADCGTIGNPQLAGPVSATTGPWGDVTGDGLANLEDVLCMMDAIGGNFQFCSFLAVDIVPCAPDGNPNLEDVLALLNILGGDDVYPCPIPCP